MIKATLYRHWFIFPDARLIHIDTTETPPEALNLWSGMKAPRHIKTTILEEIEYQEQFTSSFGDIWPYNEMDQMEHLRR